MVHKVLQCDKNDQIVNCDALKKKKKENLPFYSVIDGSDLKSCNFIENSPFNWWLRDGSTKLPPEVEKDNIEYKWKLTDISQDRKNHLVTQMRWRVGESGFCWYILGVKDDGTLEGINESDLQGTLTVLQELVNQAKLFIESIQVVQLTMTHCNQNRDKFISQVKIEVDHHMRIGNDFNDLTIDPTLSNDRPSSSSLSRPVKEIKVAFLGDFESGKSSLISVLSDWGSLDDSNGKMRTRLLHHRHELLSGTTSSLSVQSVGLKSGGLESIVLTDESLFLKLEKMKEILVSEEVKIVHFIDTAGQVKFDHTVLSVLTCVPSPSVVFIVIKAPECMKEAKISAQTREYFKLAKVLKINVSVIFSKIDKSSTELILLLIDRLVESVGNDYKFELFEDAATTVLPSNELKCQIFPCSAVSGEYLEQINSYLYSSASISNSLLDPSLLASIKSIFIIEQVVKEVEINGKCCLVLFGRVMKGSISVNETLFIGPHQKDPITGKFSTPLCVASLQRLKFPIKEAKVGEHVTIAIESLRSLNIDMDVNKGMVLFSPVQFQDDTLQFKPIKRIIAGLSSINVTDVDRTPTPTLSKLITYKGSVFINGQKFSHCTLDIEPSSRSLRRLRAAHPQSERICLISFAESKPATVFIQPGVPIIFIESSTKNRDKFAGIIIDYFS